MAGGILMLACCLPGWVQAAPDAGEVKAKIARKIWQNECAGTVRGLVSWNRGEAFPSLGIGHFIWFPAGVRERFEESFPSFVRFCRKRGARVPEWFSGAAPWRTRGEFEAADVRGGLPERMRQWLSSPAALQMQADFIISRSVASLGRIKSQSRRPAEMAARYNAVAMAPNGMYALIDYVNFKGEGTNPAERYRGQGWGLMQVLEEMRPAAPGQPAAAEFAEAAKRVLQRRVENSPAGRGEARWLAGWKNRCDSYKRSL
ncbi:hypothetical protein [Akkermansia sp.]|uniref:hypothetical protein n=1 Tax=Akkermansia sp. TaxID=1872421 RepID=UPI0025C0C51F|nr:hypothetical protein [Akkermansia sp.]